MTSLPLNSRATFVTLSPMGTKGSNPIRQLWHNLKKTNALMKALDNHRNTVKPGEIRVIGLNQWIRVHHHEICVAGYEDRLVDKFRIDFDTSTHHKGPEIILEDGITLAPAPHPNAPRIVFVDVIYRNSQPDRQLTGRRNQWWLYDADGYSYEALSANRWLYENNNKQFLGGSRHLTPGTKVRGWVGFELPREAVPERLQFVDGFLSGNTADFWIFGQPPAQLDRSSNC